MADYYGVKGWKTQKNPEIREDILRRNIRSGQRGAPFLQQIDKWLTKKLIEPLLKKEKKKEKTVDARDLIKQYMEEDRLKALQNLTAQSNIPAQTNMPMQTQASNVYNQKAFEQFARELMKGAK